MSWVPRNGGGRGSEDKRKGLSFLLMNESVSLYLFLSWRKEWFPLACACTAVLLPLSG